MEHTNTNEIFNKKGKKATGITAILVAASLVASGVVAAALFKGNTASTEPETTIESTTQEPEMDLMILTEDFDINDKEAVNARAKAIYNISEKEYEIIDIANMIYILGEKYDAITYPEGVKSDKEKFEYLQQLALLLGTVLDDGLYEYTDALVNEEIILGEQTPVPCAYMFMATSTEGKKQAIELAKIYYEQRDNVKNKDDAAMKTTATKYYDLVKSLYEMDLGPSDRFALFGEISAKNAIFTRFLSKEITEAEDYVSLDEILDASITVTNKIFFDAAEALEIRNLSGIDKTPTVLPTGESYNAKDVEDAITHPAVQKDNTKSTTKVIEQGGQPVKGSTGAKETINEPTTSVHKEEVTIKVPTTTVPTQKVEEGGKVVEEETFVVDIGNYEGTTSIVIEEGGIVLSEKYVDEDAAKAEELGNTYTLG